MSNTNYVSQRRLKLFFNKILNMFITRNEYNDSITHYDNRRICTYDPDNTDKSSSYILLCNEIVTPEEFTKSIWEVNYNSQNYTFTPEIVNQFSWLAEHECYFCTFRTPLNFTSFAPDEIVEFQCLIFPNPTGSISTPGTYLTKENLFSFELPNNKINLNIGEIKTLDEKFIPETYAKKSDLEDYAYSRSDIDNIFVSLDTALFNVVGSGVLL